VFHIGIAAGTKADGEIGIFSYHVEQGDADLQCQVNLGVGLGELAQPGHEDGARKRGCDGHLELAPTGQRPLAGEAPQNGQAFADMRQVFAAFAGQRKVGPPEQLGANDLFQLLDPVADRAGRDAQLFSGLCHAAQSRQGFKSEQALNGRYAGSHAAIVSPHSYSVQARVNDKKDSCHRF
jgi:hypothetical protein